MYMPWRLALTGRLLLLQLVETSSCGTRSQEMRKMSLKVTQVVFTRWYSVHWEKYSLAVVVITQLNCGM